MNRSNLTSMSRSNVGHSAVTKTNKACPCAQKHVVCREEIHAAGEAKCKWDDEADSIYFYGKKDAVAEYYNSPTKRNASVPKKRSNSNATSPSVASPKGNKSNRSKSSPKSMSKKNKGNMSASSSSPRSVQKINDTANAPVAESVSRQNPGDSLTLLLPARKSQDPKKDALSPLAESMPMSGSDFGLPVAARESMPMPGGDLILPVADRENGDIPRDNSNALLNGSMPMPGGDVDSPMADMELGFIPEEDMRASETPYYVPEEEELGPRLSENLLRATVIERRDQQSENQRESDLEAHMLEDTDAPETYPEDAEPMVPELEGTERSWDEDDKELNKSELPQKTRGINYCCCLICMLILLLILIAIILFLFLYRTEYNCNIFQEQCCLTDHCVQTKQCFGTTEYSTDYCVYSLSSCEDQCVAFE
eukprot:GEMP01020533.1.p1 GENE.GEMP01020533.1~~GEMP01020533.1.p1  ORF type:complete len:423 (+),score=78.23 GEMP01020533.1:243-1511(+)